MSIKKDIVIFGGGIAGLWLLNRLRQQGYDAMLLEKNQLGAGQSVASQGMIHGGIKYALGGALTGASNAIAEMPAYWLACLAGEGDVDLRNTSLLSREYYMWPRNSLRSRLNAFLGSKAIQGKVDTVARSDYPAFLHGNIPGPLYQLRDVVLDVPSLLHNLQSMQAAHIFKIRSEATHIDHSAHGIDSLLLENGSRIEASRYIFTAGAGNAELLGLWGKELRPAGFNMQKRPLQMGIVKHSIHDPLYVHCVSDQLTATPEVTITTHRCADGRSAWYLGGEIAEAGAHQDQQTFIARCQQKLADLFPWCPLQDAEWQSFYIDRAEQQQADGKRPDSSSIAELGNVLLCWPTKLTLSPNLANEVLARLKGVQASGTSSALPDLPHPEVAPGPWDSLEGYRQ